jgi:chromosome segregation ATPase
VTVIGRDYDIEQLTLLLQLILGCAINCERKDDFIAVMTNLDLEVQHGLRIAIQELETIEETNLEANSSIDTKTDKELSELQKRCLELESIVDKLKDEKLSLQLENEKLVEKLRSTPAFDPNSGQRDSYDNEAVFQRLNHQINALQNDLSKMEELKEDYRLNAELREEEVNKMRQQMDQMQSKLNDFKHDRDELDRLRYLIEEVDRYKTMAEVHKKKIEELNESKRQLKLIEERNVTLTKRICELEEETKKQSVLKGQIELYKKQKEDLRLKVGEESYRADKAEDEAKRITKKFEELIQEREKYNNEISDLKIELSQYKGVNQLNTISMDVEYTPVVQNNQHSVESMQKSDNDSSQREKLIRLEFENSKLRDKLTNSDDERVKLLESELEDEKVRVSELENENRLINQRIIQLEGQLSDLHRVSEDDQMQAFQDIVKQKEVSLEATKHELQDAQQLISSLKVILAKKEDELLEKEDQYKKYVNKAKVTLDQISNSIASGSSYTSSSSDSSNDLNYWKQLVQQKELEIIKMKSDFEKSNAFKEMEERLMTITFHNLVSL